MESYPEGHDPYYLDPHHRRGEYSGSENSYYRDYSSRSRTPGPPAKYDNDECYEQQGRQISEELAPEKKPDFASPEAMMTRLIKQNVL